ncbi:hypothetical protein BBJ29_002216 [Phytophthora kernoviae]|uniref:tRNA (guanine(37)-N1)-methyltransferase n=1 Tax=Phytophthora kernoviae TaxID=325452 RepID=A0A3F2RV74_9STRA|nr:hypothetical protein BBJ29_002216 [Phytophthora kernoviae]RLN64844.1 hypothetical protein BBP00_00003188 [Phytophthora kernoviae]
MANNFVWKTLQVVGVRVEAKKVGKVVKKLHSHLLNLPRLSNVVSDPANTNMKLVLLNTNVHSPETLQPLREQLKGFLHAESFSFAPHVVQMNCEDDTEGQEVMDESIIDNRDQVAKTGNVSFHPIDNDNVQQLHELNESLFPIKYGEAFYEYVPNAPDGFCKLAIEQLLCHCYIMSKPLLDKSLFKKTLQVIGVRVEAKKIGRVVKKLHGNLLNLPRLRNVVPDPTNPDPYKNSSSKLILLNAKVTDADTLQPLNEELVSFLKEESLAFVSHAIELDYSYFAVDQVLSELLPKDMDIPSSFETVGHIAHLNLRDNQLPYKNIIGQVILDKNAQIRTVVNKTDNIETQFRTFPMEVLAGDDDLNVEVHESKATFRFNYAEVYWNSRLQQEHLRIIRQIKPRDVVCDMMCGIGPFAIPLALNGCKVYANDLNPRSFHYLKENIALNKVDKLITPYNQDGREFLAELLSEKKQFTQVLMNLPAIALEFLDAFPGQFDHWEGDLPYIHCYCFSNADDVKKDVKERAEKIMGGELNPETTSFHLVRDVAPKKVMVCISFQLPESIAFSSERQASKQDEPKRRKVEAESSA